LQSNAQRLLDGQEGVRVDVVGQVHVRNRRPELLRSISWISVKRHLFWLQK
jgi:hypothetical protein